MLRLKFLFFCFSMPCFLASAEEPTTKLVVWDVFGQKYVYVLSSNPKITFTDAFLSIAIEGDEVLYNIDSIERFTYENAGVQTDIVDIQTDRDFIYNGNTLILPYLAANSTVSVYSLSGTKVLTKHIKNAGEYALTLHSLSTGTYLVNVNGKTFKILKK